MAYDQGLAGRIRELVSAEQGVTEKQMFGGLAFLIHGNMSISASSQGGMLVRVAPADTASLLEEPHVRRFAMGGRTIPGWLRVDSEGLRTRHQLEAWVGRGTAYARSLPAKG